MPAADLPSNTPDTSLPRRQFLVRAGAFCLATPLLWSDEAHAANHKISLTINGFGASDKAKVEKGFWIAMDRCFKEKVIKLTAKNTFRSRGLPHGKGDVSYKRGKEAEEALSYFVVYSLEKMLRIKNDSFDFAIEINAADLDGAVGQAPLGLSTVWGYYKKEENKRPQYSIKLDKTAVSKRSEADTGGTIWHEMMHNAGLSHKSGGSYEDCYEGYLIKEWGLAIGCNGVEGFGLTNDPYARTGCG